ncbi:MAG: glutathione synthase [Prochlorotrichaceae cyanobacterium]
MKCLFILDPISALDPGHDTTIALMEATQARHHEVWITEMRTLEVEGGQAWAVVQPVQLDPVKWENDRWRIPQPWFRLGEKQRLKLEAFAVVWMRKDPPVTVPYLYATYILDYVNPEKTLVVNRPEGLRTANEKMYALQFSAVIPETIVTQSKESIKAFLAEREGAVLKPLGGKAGEGILFLHRDDRNLNSLIEISTNQGQVPVMVQQFLPEAKLGDKRIILLNGEPIGAVNRVPTGSEFRGNMAVGGRVEASPITERDRFICEQVAPALQRDGLYFVGIDVIGGFLTEVNVTSPTGIREIDRLNNICLGDRVVQWLETR